MRGEEEKCSVRIKLKGRCMVGWEGSVGRGRVGECWSRKKGNSRKRMKGLVVVVVGGGGVEDEDEEDGERVICLSDVGGSPRDKTFR